jgi:F0F1-type ATP synthase assembly protein I
LPIFNKQRSDEDDKSSSNLYRLSGMGIELTASVVGMALVGWLLDWALGTGPWLLVTFAVLGIIGGTYNFIKGALKENRAQQAQWRKRHAAPPPQQPDRPAPKPGVGGAPPAQPTTEPPAESPASPEQEERRDG